MEPLHALAQACDLAREWIDVEGRRQQASNDALAAILQALGHDTDGERQISRSLMTIAERNRALPAMLITDEGAILGLPVTAKRAEITGSDGVTRPIPIDGDRLSVIAKPGYYDLSLDSRTLKLAVAPTKCPLPLAKGHRPWGVSLQIPSLRDEVPAAFGTFGELTRAVEHLGKKGADAVAINPVHALFPGHGEGFSPYSPSSRLFINGAMADPGLVGLPSLPSGEARPLIDWEGSLPRRLQELRRVFTELEPTLRVRIASESGAGDKALYRHALFDALDCHFRPTGAHGWRDWPASYRNPDSQVVTRFAVENREEIEFHLFIQWLARQGLESAHKAAQDAEMAIGLIADLAVGVDPSGSDAWSMRDQMLQNLSIGAPPDPLGPHGQNWSITSFSPGGLKETGYEPWIAMMRSAFASCGGLRIDHAFGLARLWVIPEGGSAGDGAYLNYPFADLVRLVTLEAHRANALVIAEDLGTAPEGFTDAVTDRQMLGMRVLWFERAADHGFIGAQDYEPLSAAMTSTHDTVTVAGWWSGRDLDWAEKLGRLPPGIDRAKAEEIRDWDRGLLWSTIGDGTPRPAPSDAQPAVDAAIAHIGRTPSLVAIVPLEDMAGLEEQPNLPGTVDQHPNWRRRLDTPVEELFEDSLISKRCAVFRAARAENDTVGN